MPVKVRALPSAEYLRERLDYDPDTGILTWKPKDASYGVRWRNWNSRYAGKKAGNVATSKRGYQSILIGIDGEIFPAHRIIWKMMTDEDPPQMIDHKDGDGTNNRWGNLRDGVKWNHLNYAKYSNNSSGISGVSRMSRSSKWRADVSINGKQKYLGCFDDIDEAARAVAAARKKAGYDPRHGQELAPYAARF